MEAKGVVAVCGTAVTSLWVHVISQTLHCSDLSVVSGLLLLDYSSCTAAGGVHIYYQLVEMGTAPPIVPGHDMFRPMKRCSNRHVYSTVAIVQLRGIVEQWL